MPYRVEVEYDAPKPWHRFFARQIDLYLMFALAGLLWLTSQYIFQVKTFEINQYLVILILSIVALILNSLFFGMFRNTLGKQLFGIKVILEDWSLPTMWVYFQREFSVWVKGMGLGIPLIAIITLLVAFGASSRGELSTWDANCGTFVVQKHIGFIRAFLGFLLWLSIVLLFVAVTVISRDLK